MYERKICVFVYVCLYDQVCMHVCVKCMGVWKYVRMYACVCRVLGTIGNKKGNFGMYVCICMCVCMYVCVCTNVCTYVCMYVCMYVLCRALDAQKKESTCVVIRDGKQVYTHTQY